MNLELPEVHPVVLMEGQLVLLDLSSSNSAIAGMGVNDYVENELQGRIGIGQYGEDRGIYRTAAFNGRTVHLGIDVCVPEGTPVFSVLPGRVHSFADNDAVCDYGPTIIMEHELDGEIFYLLYGHLSRSSLNITVGQAFNAGQQIGTIGSREENGNWFTHLHFQLINDLQGNSGDYPGVCRPDEFDFYQKNCPDPSYFLGIMNNL